MGKQLKSLDGYPGEKSFDKARDYPKPTELGGKGKSKGRKSKSRKSKSSY